MAWKRTTAAPLFTPFQLIVLCAVLFGLRGKDGECKGRSARSLLGKILFPGIDESLALFRVQRALDDSVIDKLMAAVGQEILSLPTKEDREFIWRVRQEYPDGMKQFGEAIYNFELGRGLPVYKPVQIPWREPEPPKTKPEPKPEVKRGRPPLPKKPPISGSRRPWVDYGEKQKKPAKQPFAAVSPRVVKPRSVFEIGITPPPYGSSKIMCKTIGDHLWKEKVSVSDFCVLECKKCEAGGQIDGKDAQERWAQLQAAMAARDKVA